jgi:short-subunit dehydrogenase
MSFANKYGPWALVAGASEGLGAAFAEALAARGLSLVLLARRSELLEEVARGVRARHGVEVRTHAVDLARPDLGAVLREVTDGVDLGCAVYNAAFAPIGHVLDRREDELLRVVDVNVRGPLLLSRALAPKFVAQGRGGLVLMSSMAGFQGAPNIATYAASKAFTTVLGEGLWAELAPRGVDVVVSCAGAIRTPNYGGASAKPAPGTLDPREVADETLDALGRSPSVVPGMTNRFARFLLGRLVPRRTAINLMAANTRTLKETP